MRPGWSNFNGTDEQADWLAGNPIKVRVGIDSNSYISIETLRNGTDWVVHARTSYPIPEGSSYRLGIKTNHTGARVFTLPKVHLVEPDLPTMNFRWIESPDGTFIYPLFATAEEANYYDEIHNGLDAGTGSSHTHTYADDPTNTNWYMPEASHDPTSYHFSSAPSGTETFSGNTINWTTITSLTNADLTPAAFSGDNYTHEEGTAINLQLYPAGATFTQSVDVTPTGSGLAYNTTSGYLQGTLTDVGSDTVYTVTVTRANSYGSSTGTFTITSTDVAPAQTSSTPWTKALDFSGGNEQLITSSTVVGVTALSMYGRSVTTASPGLSGYTTADASGQPWATAIVFRTDGNNSNQHIWNHGEGASTNNDNIYLRLSSGGQIYFGWGREGSGYNEKQLATVLAGQWYGVYIAHNGTRLYSTDASAANLDSVFDIRVARPNDISNDVDASSYYVTPSGYWTTINNRMDLEVAGALTIGGRGNNRSFHGKVASMVVTTLERNVAMPGDAEIKKMITDPTGWLTDYKIGNDYGNFAGGASSTNFQLGNFTSSIATQVWLMGDGTSDSYANGVRNQVHSEEQNYTKLVFTNMVSNDIETVNINGLT